MRDWTFKEQWEKTVTAGPHSETCINLEIARMLIEKINPKHSEISRRTRQSGSPKTGAFSAEMLQR